MFPAKTKIFTMWLLQKEFANSWSKAVVSNQRKFCPLGTFCTVSKYFDFHSWKRWGKDAAGSWWVEARDATEQCTEWLRQNVHEDSLPPQTLSSDPSSHWADLGLHPVSGLPSPVLTRILISQCSDILPPALLISDHP